ncbi:MAG TPA: DUF4349 domain-containing protein [Terriglobales bacterium]|jgi:cell division protein FtsL
MSTITLNLPKPLRPGMAWVIAGIVIFLLATTLVTRNNANVKFAANAPLTARQSNMEGYLDEQSVGGLLAPPERKIVHTCSLDLTVSSPSQTAEQVRLLAEKLGGYLENAESGGQSSSQASITIRIPATQLESAKAEIRKLALRIEGEKTDASDVTKQYVDMQARLRNLRAEEAQYLQIMKSAAKVKDMLDVTEKLTEVRGQIEQQQAEFEALSKQVEMASISISLHVPTDTEVMGIHWRPLYQMKLASRDGLKALADYATAMMAVIFILPAALLWTGTILLGVFLAWRILRWIARLFFPSLKAIGQKEIA